MVGQKCCLLTQTREIWFRCLDIHSKLSQTLQLSTLQLNLLFSNAIHFTMNLQLRHLKRASHPVKYFWCNCEKGYICRSRRDVVKHSRKIWRMQRKSISISSANSFNAKNADILPFSIRWIHNCILLLNVSDTSKRILAFPCLELFSWFKRIKNHLRIFGNRLAVDKSFCKVTILFF